MADLKAQQKAATKMCMGRPALPPPPYTITITRLGPCILDDDNLCGACKYVRDQIAAYIGIDDGSDEYTWQYRQRIGRYGVDVEITERQ